MRDLLVIIWFAVWVDFGCFRVGCLVFSLLTISVIDLLHFWVVCCLVCVWVGVAGFAFWCLGLMFGLGLGLLSCLLFCTWWILVYLCSACFLCVGVIP